MAKAYFEKLFVLLNEINLESDTSTPMEVNHFFSGAALYVNQAICASWSPAGLAFKLSEQEAENLIACGKAAPLKYFAKGHIKKGYALFENPDGKYSVSGKLIHQGNSTASNKRIGAGMTKSIGTRWLPKAAKNGHPLRG